MPFCREGFLNKARYLYYLSTQNRHRESRKPPRIPTSWGSIECMCAVQTRINLTRDGWERAWSCSRCSIVCLMEELNGLYTRSNWKLNPLCALLYWTSTHFLLLLLLHLRLDCSIREQCAVLSCTGEWRQWLWLQDSQFDYYEEIKFTERFDSKCPLSDCSLEWHCAQSS